MSYEIDLLVKSMMTNGNFPYYEEMYFHLELNSFFCSTFIEKEKFLVKGECEVSNVSRKALLVFLDVETNRVEGGTIFSVFQ